MRPGRPRPLRHSAAQPGRATRPHPSRPRAQATDLGEAARCVPVTLGRMSAGTRRRAGAPGEGRGGGSSRSASTAEKNAALLAAADLLVASRAVTSSRPTPPTSTPPRPRGMEPARSTACASPKPGSPGMADGLRDVAALADPVGEVLDGWRAAQRPADRAGAGAARRGRDHLREPAQRHQRRRRHLPEVGQRRAPARARPPRCARTWPSPRCCATAATKAGLPADCVLLVDDVRHEAAVELMQLTDVVDCLIPRGGPVAHPEHPRARDRARDHRR